MKGRGDREGQKGRRRAEGQKIRGLEDKKMRNDKCWN
jgi:hypothetical protein